MANKLEMNVFAKNYAAAHPRASEFDSGEGAMYRFFGLVPHDENDRRDMIEALRREIALNEILALRVPEKRLSHSEDTANLAYLLESIQNYKLN